MRSRANVDRNRLRTIGSRRCPNRIPGGGSRYHYRSERFLRGLPARPAAGSGVRLPAVTICSRQPSRVQPRDQLADYRVKSLPTSFRSALHADQHGMEKMRELAQVVRERANVVHG